MAKRNFLKFLVDGVADIVTRERHSRGYGVHSPLAYRLVKHVFRPPRDVVYYGEEKLETMRPDNPRMVGSARFLLRLVAELQPRKVWMTSGIDLWVPAAKLGGALKVTTERTDPEGWVDADLVVAWDLPKPDRLDAMMAPGRSLLVRGRIADSISPVSDRFKGGVLIDDRLRGILAVNREGDARHIYPI